MANSIAVKTMISQAEVGQAWTSRALLAGSRATCAGGYACRAEIRLGLGKVGAPRGPPADSVSLAACATRLECPSILQVVMKPAPPAYAFEPAPAGRSACSSGVSMWTEVPPLGPLSIHIR